MKFNLNDIKDTAALDINIEVEPNVITLEGQPFAMTENEQQAFIVNAEKLAESVKIDEVEGKTKTNVNKGLIVNMLLLLATTPVKMTKGDLVKEYKRILDDVDSYNKMLEQEKEEVEHD